MKLFCNECEFTFYLSRENYDLCYTDPYCPKCGKLTPVHLPSEAEKLAWKKMSESMEALE